MGYLLYCRTVKLHALMDKSLTSFTFLFMAGSFIIAVTAQFTVQPVSVERAEGLEAVFNCRYQVEGFTDNYFWYMNNVVVGPDTETVRTRPPSSPAGGLATLIILATPQHNNSVVYCSAVIINGTGITLADSSTASLVVRETVLTHFIVAPNTITVMWNALPLTEYCVDITRTTLDSTETVVLDSLCGFTNEYIYMYSDNSVCARFTVTPTDGEMRGTTSELCTGLFTRVEGGEQHRILETKRNKLVKFRATVPSCTKFTRYRVDSDLLTPSIDRSITDPFLFDGSLSFSLPTDKMTEYSVTLTDENGIDFVFENIPISTFDVQDLLVSECPGSGGICVSIVYVEGTLSPGALVCAIRIIDGVFDFANMKLVTIPRNSIENFTIPVPSGEYRVIAFDLESNHLPRMPVSMVALSQNEMTVNLIGEDITSPPPREGISATRLINQEVSVICSDSALNCIVLFQSTTILKRVLVGFINASSTSTVISLNATFGDGYVVVYSWNTSQSIFEGEVSLIIQLDLPTTTAPTTPPTSDPQTDPPPPDIESLPTSVIAAAAIAGLVILLLLVVTTVGTVVVILRKRRQNEVEVPESDGRVDWSSTFAGIEQPNEAYASVLKLKKNIAYEQTKKPRGQRIDDSQASATTEGHYESIEPVHVYEDVLPQGKASHANYVNVN
ncbi:uncharacterized protein LOC135339045 isoform X2 [Halichondria panicea]|uniref:uncharacterized protein LOC135339045 isoform X2 n=1 Tax=Halichondria panicea TaxID=6063 RepID=UPI00312BC0F3